MNWSTLLARTGTILFDGANGTEYQRRGLPPGSPPESLVLTNPALVKQVHQEYVAAGSNVITTNTFGANRKRLAASGLAEKISELNRVAVELAFAAANNYVVVAGSVGPLGAILEPYGDVSRTEASEIFGEQMHLLRDAGVEVVLIETMISLDEALLALQAARDAGFTVVSIAMTYEPTPHGPRTAFGERPTDVARTLLQQGATIIGSNCGKGFDVMRQVASELVTVVDPSRILLQPNAGIPTFSSGSIVYPESPERFGDFVREMSALGIRFLGGCCGTTPEHLACGKWILEQRQKV